MASSKIKVKRRMARYLKRIQVFAAILAVIVLVASEHMVGKGMKRDRNVGGRVKRGPMQNAFILKFVVITARPQKMQSQGNVVSFSRNANANSVRPHSEESIHIIRSIFSYVFVFVFRG
ncbi:hypothetical protein CR513_38139, partial [Mucuna pruriens]